MQDNDRRKNDSEIFTVLGRLEQKVDGLAESNDKLEKRLFGNGQPGELQIQSSRILILENYKTQAAGWMAGAVAVLAVLAGIIEFAIHTVFK